MGFLHRRRRSSTHWKNVSNHSPKASSCRKSNAASTTCSIDEELPSTSLLEDDNNDLSSTSIDIWTACKSGKVDIVREALRHSPELIHVTYQGRSPLYYACHCGHKKIVELLLAAGATDDELQSCYQSALNHKIRRLLQQQQHQQQSTHKSVCLDVDDQIQTPVTSSSSSSGADFFGDDDMFHSLFDTLISKCSTDSKDINHGSDTTKDMIGVENGTKMCALGTTNPIVYSDSLLTERVHNFTKSDMADMKSAIASDCTDQPSILQQPDKICDVKNCSLIVTGIARETSLMDSSMFEGEICSAATQEEFLLRDQLPPSQLNTLVSPSTYSSSTRTIETTGDSVEVQESVLHRKTTQEHVRSDEVLVTKKNRFLSFVIPHKKKHNAPQASSTTQLKGGLSSNAISGSDENHPNDSSRNNAAAKSLPCNTNELYSKSIISSIGDENISSNEAPSKSSSTPTSDLTKRHLLGGVVATTESPISDPLILSTPRSMKRDETASSWGTFDTNITNDMMKLIPLTTIPVMTDSDSEHPASKSILQNRTLVPSTKSTAFREVSIDFCNSNGVELSSAIDIPEPEVEKTTTETSVPKRQGWHRILPSLRPRRNDAAVPIDNTTLNEPSKEECSFNKEDVPISKPLSTKINSDDIECPDIATVATSETSDDSIAIGHESSMTSSIRRQKSSLHHTLDGSSTTLGSTTLNDNSGSGQSLLESTMDAFNCFTDNVIDDGDDNDDADACTFETMSFDAPLPALHSESTLPTARGGFDTNPVNDDLEIITSDSPATLSGKSSTSRIDQILNDTSSCLDDPSPSNSVGGRGHDQMALSSEKMDEIYSAEIDDEVNAVADNRDAENKIQSLITNRTGSGEKSTISSFSAFSSLDEDEHEDDSFIYEDDDECHSRSSSTVHNDEKPFGCVNLFCG